MNRICFVLCCLMLLMPLLVGCESRSVASDYRDVAAVDLAFATMADAPEPVPTPTPDKCERCGGTGWVTHGDGHKTRCPDCNDGDAGGLPTGPLSTIKDAKELIRKANAAVDRGTAILDAVERDGKVSVDIKIPQPACEDGCKTVCSGGQCYRICPASNIRDSPLSDESETEQETETTQTTCQQCYQPIRRGLFWRWRR